MSACFVCASVAGAAAQRDVAPATNVAHAALGVLAGVVVAGAHRVVAGLCDEHTRLLWPLIVRFRPTPDGRPRSSGPSN